MRKASARAGIRKEFRRNCKTNFIRRSRQSSSVLHQRWSKKSRGSLHSGRASTGRRNRARPALSRKSSKRKPAQERLAAVRAGLPAAVARLDLAALSPPHLRQDLSRFARISTWPYTANAARFSQSNSACNLHNALVTLGFFATAD